MSDLAARHFVGVRVMYDPFPSRSPRVQKPIRADGVREPSSGPYTAKLTGWSDEALADKDFFLLVDAIRWLTAAEENGAIAKRASIYAVDGRMVWTKLFARARNPREKAMKQNAQRILMQVVDRDVHSQP